MRRVYNAATYLIIGFSLVNCFAQNKSITGRIVDEHLNPLSSAFIYSLDSLNVSKTDSNGYFSLEIPKKTRKTKVQCIGMETEIFRLGNNCVFNIVLFDDLIAEFETEKEHRKLYKKRKKALTKIYQKAIQSEIFGPNKPCN